jgi:DNA polymerase III alpha subunit (gram-positive type)
LIIGIEQINNFNWDLIPDEFVIFDVETTGLDFSKDRIIEIGAIIFNKKEYLAKKEVISFQVFIKQDNPIPSEATAINNITDEMVGIQGVALGVSSEFKNLGIGKMLINYPATLGYDYVWGYQLRALDNINDWLKRRKIYSETGNMFTTYQIFNSNE